MVNNLEIGKTYYVAGCSPEYQIENSIVAVHKERTYYMAEDDNREKNKFGTIGFHQTESLGTLALH